MGVVGMHTGTAFVICRLLNDGYPDLVKLHLTVILIYISLIISSVEHLYMRLLIICMSLWRNVYLGLLTIFWLGCFCCCCCTGCLYISEINPLSVASFASIFSHSVDCLSVLFMVSFAVQKLASLIRSHLFIFASFLLSWDTYTVSGNVNLWNHYGKYAHNYFKMDYNPNI